LESVPRAEQGATDRHLIERARSQIQCSQICRPR
jgi:hypothetical protein